MSHTEFSISEWISESG